MSTIRLPSRSRRWPLIVIGVLVLLAILFTALSGAVVDLLWYREIGQSSVFWTTIRTRFLLALVFGLLFFGLLYANLIIARRIRPTTRIMTPDQEVLARVRDASDPYLRWLVPVGAGILALLVGIGVSGEWKTFLLWRGGSGILFGNPDPLFHRDPSFYIFTMPWLRFLQGWLFSSLVGVTIIVGVAHLLWGGIRPQAPMFADKVTPAARAHLSVLLGLIMLVKAWGYWLGRYDLLTSTRGVVEGASYTDVKAQLPALTFLTIVAVICAILFFLNIRLRQRSLPVIAVGLLLLVSVLLGTAYPAFVQQFRVEPNEQNYESPYITDNITATNEAFALNTIQAQQHPVTGPLSAQQIQDNSGTVSNIRVWRGVPILEENFQSLQRQRQYYNFDDVDVDRYKIEGQERVLMVSPREIDQAGLAPAAQTWPNQHLTYTHGYGAVAAQVNTATSQGQPVFRLQDLPPETKDEALTMKQPEIYYGESNDVPFVVTNTNITEDNPQGGSTAPYAGKGGIELSNFIRRAMFAWKYRDYNLLVSSSITSKSKILIYRDIQTRIRKPVPFLGFDSDPYFAIIDGQPEWIWDAYTYTDQYPYSQAVDVNDATGGLLQGNVNYLRNSVKAVMNAYDGTITYYAYLTGDRADPIIQAWSNAFPGLFTDITQAPPDIQAHFRYPENLFQVQAFQYTNYHVTSASAFYQKSDFWAVPDDPTVPATQASVPMRPSYQLIRLPGQDTEAFQLVIPFVPADRQNMVAWMAASSDPADFGKLTVFRLPEGRNIEGPTQVMSRINQDPTFSAQRTLLGQGGSTVQFGDFLVIPIDDSFLYAVPVYVRAVQEAAVPELKQVIIVNGSQGEVSLGNDLDTALRAAVTGLPSTGGGNGGNPPPTGSVSQQIQRLLAEAQTHFLNAQAALRAGDLATYQSEIDAAQQDVNQASKLSGQSQTPTTSPSASPSASASPSG
jgi:uncharacterized protein